MLLNNVGSKFVNEAYGKAKGDGFIFYGLLLADIRLTACRYFYPI